MDIRVLLDAPSLAGGAGALPDHPTSGQS